MRLKKIAKSIGGAFLPIVGDIIGGALGSSAQKKANKANLQLQREQQGWEKMMSDTSWQRGMEDMKAAGMNPMLAFSQGGASTPSVSAATAQPVDAMAKSVGSAATKAMQTAAINLTEQQARKAGAEADVASADAAARAPQAQERANLEVTMLNRQIDQMISQAHSIDATTERTKEEKAKIIAEIERIKGMMPLEQAASKATTKLQELQVPSAKAEAELWESAGKEGKAIGMAGQLMELARRLAILTRK
ncbi:MAG: DNA pilot protein [Arizlama microvirus]|nr:MAG: DNA pilot protein [Arizlama microvirus]